MKNAELSPLFLSHSSCECPPSGLDRSTSSPHSAQKDNFDMRRFLLGGSPIENYQQTNKSGPNPKEYNGPPS